MELKKEAFRKCIFNPLDEDFAAKSGRLMVINDNVPMMKFIVAMYDPGSPLRSTYPELDLRAVAAAQVARYDLPEEWMDENMVNAVVEFLKIVNNRTWTMIVSIEQALWEYATRLLLPITKVGAGQDKDTIAAVNMKNATADNMISLDDKLESLLKKFYSDPELEKAAREKGKVSRYSSESIAKALKNR